MVSTIEPRTDVAQPLPTPCTAADPVAARIAAFEQERHARLLQRAQGMRLAFDLDYISADGMIVWNPTIRGRCEVVEPTGCSCREHRLWGNCPHFALFTEIMSGEVDTRPRQTRYRTS